MSASQASSPKSGGPETLPDELGHFGPYGGRFVPENLMPALEELHAAFLTAQKDPAFQAELDDLLANYAGRPTPCTRPRTWPRPWAGRASS